MLTRSTQHAARSTQTATIADVLPELHANARGKTYHYD